MARIKNLPKRGPRTVIIPEKAIKMMERVMGAPPIKASWLRDSDWTRTPRYKGGRLRRRMYTLKDLPAPKELEDEL